MNHRYQEWTTGDVDQVRELAAQGLTCREAALQMGRTWGAVNQVAMKNGIHFGQRPARSLTSRERLLRRRAQIETSNPDLLGTQLLGVAIRIGMNLDDLRRVIAELVAKPRGRKYRAIQRVQMGWRDKAACVDADPEIFYVEQGGTPTDALEFCLDCPVRVECLAEGIRNRERFGIWGGVNERNRRRVAKLVKAAAERALEASA